ncbi:hypothetical protein DIPPA_12593 [Diplonema papillatum]|nr:hypothetical protein DIPPA_12593 [Diplonema papillatum]
MAMNVLHKFDENLREARLELVDMEKRLSDEQQANVLLTEETDSLRKDIDDRQDRVLELKKRLETTDESVQQLRLDNKCAQLQYDKTMAAKEEWQSRVNEAESDLLRELRSTVESCHSVNERWLGEMNEDVLTSLLTYQVRRHAKTA